MTTRIQAFFLPPTLRTDEFRIRMSKDPAFLFYFRDFLVSTALMTPGEVGSYIRILCHMADKGPLSMFQLKQIAEEGTLTQDVVGRFKVDIKGFYYSQKLIDVQEKRSKFRDSRLKNLQGSSHMGVHMDAHMENGNANENEDASESVVGFNQIKAFEEVWAKYPVKDGKKASERHFKASVKTQADFDSIKQALGNYLKSEKVLKGYVKNGSTWFNNWKDWTTYVPPAPAKIKPPADVIALTCVAQKMGDDQIKKEIISAGYTEHFAVEAIMRARGNVQ